MSVRIDWHRLKDEHGRMIAEALNTQIRSNTDCMPPQISRLEVSDIAFEEEAPSVAVAELRNVSAEFLERATADEVITPKLSLAKSFEGEVHIANLSGLRLMVHVEPAVSVGVHQNVISFPVQLHLHAVEVSLGLVVAFIEPNLVCVSVRPLLDDRPPIDGFKITAQLGDPDSKVLIDASKVGDFVSTVVKEAINKTLLFPGHIRVNLETKNVSVVASPTCDQKDRNERVMTADRLCEGH